MISSLGCKSSRSNKRELFLVSVSSSSCSYSFSLWLVTWCSQISYEWFLVCWYSYILFLKPEYHSIVYPRVAYHYCISWLENARTFYHHSTNTTIPTTFSMFHLSSCYLIICLRFSFCAEHIVWQENSNLYLNPLLIFAFVIFNSFLSRCLLVLNQCFLDNLLGLGTNQSKKIFVFLYYYPCPYFNLNNVKSLHCITLTIP